MTDTPLRHFPSMDGPAVYRIHVRGKLVPPCLELLSGINISVRRTDAGLETILVGRFEDQAALSGMLSTLYDMRMPVISVGCLDVED